MCECDRAAELLSRQLDDDPLSQEEQRFLDGHLSQCPACSALAEQFRQLHAAFPLLDEPAPAGLKDQIMARVAREGTARRKKTPIAFPAQWKSWAAMAAMFALVLLGAGPIREALLQSDAPAAAPNGASVPYGSNSEDVLAVSAGSHSDADVGLDAALNTGGTPESIQADTGYQEYASSKDSNKNDGNEVNLAGLPTPELPEVQVRATGLPLPEESALELAIALRFPDSAVLPEGWLSRCEPEGEALWTVTLTAPDGTEEIFLADLAAGTAEPVR